MRGPTAVVTMRSVVPLESFRQLGSPAKATVSIAIELRLGSKDGMNAKEHCNETGTREQGTGNRNRRAPVFADKSLVYKDAGGCDANLTDLGWMVGRRGVVCRHERGGTARSGSVDAVGRADGCRFCGGSSPGPGRLSAAV